MNSKQVQSNNAVVAAIVGVGALVAATLAASILSGLLQNIVLALCFAVMGASVLVNLLEQRKAQQKTAIQSRSAELQTVMTSAGAAVSNFPERDMWVVSPERAARPLEQRTESIAV